MWAFSGTYLQSQMHLEVHFEDQKRPKSALVNKNAIFRHYI